MIIGFYGKQKSSRLVIDEDTENFTIYRDQEGALKKIIFKGFEVIE
ncbi:MAG: hypothetical protein V3U54_13500 [Thermodesulfobacteriota bacterium]